MHTAVNPHVVRLNILFVEDNPGDADLRRERLDAARTTIFDLTRAITLEQATHVLSHRAVDAIILDLNLPDSRGIDTVRRVNFLRNDAPIIVVSGEMTEDLRTEAIKEGAEEMFSKDETNNRRR